MAASVRRRFLIEIRKQPSFAEGREETGSGHGALPSVPGKTQLASSWSYVIMKTAGNQSIRRRSFPADP
jgi:hypothetical protein